MSDDNDNKRLVFPVHYFEGIQEIKTLIHNLEDDFRQLIGDTRVIEKRNLQPRLDVL